MVYLLFFFPMQSLFHIIYGYISQLVLLLVADKITRILN